jgi:hypothetical protein
LKFKSKNLRAIADCVIGDAEHFPYRSSRYISEFFEECDLPFVHDGSTRWVWACDRLSELLEEAPSHRGMLPDRFAKLLRVLMDPADAVDGDPDRVKALETLNTPLRREGFEAFYDDGRRLQVRHLATDRILELPNPHRPLAPQEILRRDQLAAYLEVCSEDDLIEEILMPMFRQLGFHRITAAGHADKALEYGKDIWMRYTLPTMHMIYFGLQAKKGKIDAAGVSKGSNANVAEILNQLLMMIGHEIFDPEQNRRVLVDHAFIVAGGEITKQARHWLGGKLDQSKRAMVLFMDRDDILNLFVVSNIPLPKSALPDVSAQDDDDLPF